MKTAFRRYLFLKVSGFRDFLLETDATVLEPDAFLLGNWALDAVFRGSELVAGGLRAQILFVPLEQM